MNERPLISVIVSVYNGENFLTQALNSVFDQSYQNIEVIIIDDGSTDGTAEVAKPYVGNGNTRYIRQDNFGQGSGLNHGVKLARGEFLAFIDHDDKWDNDKLKMQLDAFYRDPELDVVFTHMQNFFENKEVKKLNVKKGIMPGYVPGTCLIRKDAFLKNGFFDTSIAKGYFFTWYKGMEMTGLKQELLPDLLYHRRIHGANMSISGSAKDYSDYFQAIRKIQQQRKQYEN